jgi:NMD protein affecting ribosome stability and mRNA decay
MKQGRQNRYNRLIKSKNTDVYQGKIKLTEPTVCKSCGSLFTGGRWTWKKTDKPASEAICPACRRTADNYPAGYVEIKGSFFKEHEDDLLNLVHNVGNLEKTERALERIIKILKKPNGVVVTTTGIHIARRIGEALHRSYKGKFSYDYLDADKGIRVKWERDIT